MPVTSRYLPAHCRSAPMARSRPIPSGRGKGGSIGVTVAGGLSIDGTSSTVPTGITALTGSSGAAGDITVATGSLNIVRNGLISVDTLGGTGSAGNVTVNVAGALSIDGTGQSLFTGITSQSGFSPGNSGEVRVTAGSLTVSNGGQISASTFGAGAGGDVQVTAGTLSIAGNSAISSVTFGTGTAGNVSVNVAGQLAIDGTSTTKLAGIASDSEGENTGNAGTVTVNAGTLLIVNTGQISSNTFGTGSGGSVFVTVAGRLSISGNS